MVYSDWLASAMASYPTAPEHDHIGIFLVALSDLEEARRSGPSREALLTTELVYDRALIHLCLRLGIETGPEHFKMPEKERDRLQQEIAEALPALGDELFAAGFIDGPL